MTRTWQFVMEEKVKTANGRTQERLESASRDKAYDPIRKLSLVETRAEHFLAVLQAGTVSTNVFLRKFHNFALAMNWLMGPVLVKHQWPKIRFREKRGIAWEEHVRIVERKTNRNGEPITGFAGTSGAPRPIWPCSRARTSTGTRRS